MGNMISTFLHGAVCLFLVCLLAGTLLLLFIVFLKIIFVLTDKLF